MSPDADIDAALRFAAILPDFQDWIERYGRESAAARARFGPPEIARYGSAPLQSYRSWPGEAASGGAFVFVHGGYWRAFNAEDYDFVGAAAKAVGADFYNIDYRLMPAARMEDAVSDVGEALAAIARRAAKPLVVVGHSAGAHLAACALARLDAGAAVEAVLISGVFDLEPVARSFLQAEIGLTDDEIDRFSPARRGPTPVCEQLVVVGAEETALYRVWADAYAARCSPPPRRMSVAGAHHMAVVAELGRPDAPLAREIGRKLVGA